MKTLVALSLALACATAASADPSADLLSGKHSWSASQSLLAPPKDSDWISIKDPSVVHFDNHWHVFCTLRGNKRTHATGYFRFKDWADAVNAELQVLPNHDGFFCAPQVFYFTPHKTWYLICQAISIDWKPTYQPAFGTNKDINDPKGWSKLKPFWTATAPKVKSWLDFWVICDDTKAHLFYSTMDGKVWRAETPIAKFPEQWTDPVVTIEGDVFEASHTYKVHQTKKYITLIEAQNGHGWRYFKSYVADKLDGPWQALAADKDNAFASMRNVKQTGDQWTESISHGELIRRGHDEKLEVDAANPRFVFQGVLDRDRRGKNYGDIPWRVGILDAVK